MPQIPEFTAAPPGITAPETGAEAFARAGRLTGAFFHQEGQELGGAIAGASQAAQKYLDHQEISHGAVAYAGLLAKATNDWNEAAKTADPNDPLVATRFRAQLEPQLEQFVDSFHTEAGQKWAESRIDEFRLHIFQKATADMSSRAGIAAHNNMIGVGNSLAVTARNDPSAVEHLLATVDASVTGIADAAPNLTPEARAQLVETVGRQQKEGVVRAGALGLAEQSGGDEGAMARYTARWSQYINPQEANMLVKAAQANRRAVQYDQDRARRLADKQIEEASDTRLDEIVKDAFGGNPQIGQRDIVNDPTLTRPDREHALAILRKEATPEPPARVSHETWARLMAQIHQGMPDDEPIWANMGKLTRADFQSLRAEFGQVTEARNDIPAMRGPPWEATRKAVHDALTFTIPGLTGVRDVEGENRYADFLQTFTQEVLRERRAGTLQPNAFNLQDPESLISKTRDQFQRKPEDKMKAQFQWISQYKDMGQTIKDITGTDITGVSVIDIPEGMSAEEAIKRYGSGATVRLPNGRQKVLP